VGIDGALLQDLSRAGIEWRLDPRLPADQQTGPEVYADNDLDRGHLVRRADAVWGTTVAEAQQGNADTFHYTNAAPQAAAFNQGEELWLGLEDYLLGNAAAGQRKLVVLTGPVLDPADPWYRGVQLPLRFVKVAAFVDAGELAATGYLLDQTPLVGDLTEAVAGEAPPLGPFRTFQVPIADIAALTGLDLEPLVAVDRLPVALAPAAGEPDVPAGWLRLTSLDQVRWQRR
jgi:endonuclease G